MHCHEAQDPEERRRRRLASGRQELERQAGQVRMRETGRAHPVDGERCGYRCEGGIEHADFVVVDEGCRRRRFGGTLLDFGVVEADVCRHLVKHGRHLATVGKESTHEARHQVALWDTRVFTVSLGKEKKMSVYRSIVDIIHFCFLGSLRLYCSCAYQA